MTTGTPTRQWERHTSTITRRAGRSLAVVLAAGLTACPPGTTRPPYDPMPGAAHVELDLLPSAAIEALADAMLADSLPVQKVEARDAWLESPWFDTTSGHPFHGEPLGAGVVRLRAWADPGRPEHSELTVEAVFRPLADPSLPERSKEQPLPAGHPTSKKLAAILKSLATEYGDSVPVTGPGGPPAPR